MTDEVGNLYEREDRSDRIYGAGSRLEKSAARNGQGTQYQTGRQEEKGHGTKYFYDKEGNLSKKVEAGGDTWLYAYYGNGMLKKVVKPDRSGVCFIYDPFGRRIEKAVSQAGSENALPKTGVGSTLEEAPWVQVGGGIIRKPFKKKQDSNLDAGAEQSLYVEESLEPKTEYQTVIRFLWSGNTLLHEWETGKEGKRKLREREGEKADYILKMEEKADRKARAEADKGTEPPKNLITWVFQDDFIPRAKLTEDGSYSIISDYLGTPVEAYDEEGKKVWERELDIYGRVKRSQKDRFGNTTELEGEDGFISFRYQGQYEDVETGLYYNRFRYYSPSDGCYTQVDPIGLSGNNPTLYAYVSNLNSSIDPLGLYNPWDFQFTQESISGVFQHGPFKGQSLDFVIELTKELERLPDGLTLSFERIQTGQGEVWAALNNRTLYVAQEAGLPNINANDMCGRGMNQYTKLVEAEGGGVQPLGKQPNVRC